jgi:uncharacterized FlaG/YvyC family protein
MNRFIAKTCRRNEDMAAQKTAPDVLEGEAAIVEAMKRFANDARCVESLQGFKADTETKIGNYQKAMVMQMQADLSEQALKQLAAVANFEAGMGSALQELVVREAAASFREQYPKNADMQAKAFSLAVKSLSGAQTAAGDDPIASHFNAAFNSLQGVDLMTAKGNATGTLAERVAFAQQAKEKEFQQTFMVTAAEAAEVKSLAAQAKSGDGYDFSKLSADALAKLNGLYTSINSKVGYSLHDSLGMKAVEASSDVAAGAYAEAVNAQLTAGAAKLQQARLTAFAKSFA